MDLQAKEKSITMAREMQEAMNTLVVALSGNDEREIVEAKNIVAGVLRSYKSFLEGLDDGQRAEAKKLFAHRIEAIVEKAKGLK
jgi:hypothetical protein